METIQKQLFYCAQVATEFRQKFKRDVVIDIFCYRRFGHNEGDEPSFTQPIMYKKIKQQPSTLKLYSSQLINENILTVEQYKTQIENYNKYLDQEFQSFKNYISNEQDWFTGVWSKFTTEVGFDRRGVTGVDENIIRSLGHKLFEIPKDFNPHHTIKRIFDNKKQMIKTGENIDWATAESLAFATLLNEGYPVRLVGQDSVRGTFSQKRAGITDQLNGEKFCLK
jgi:2-oxoglutarate dehydrogenase complex, dehydrogenase (E1) component, and related enzymes